MTIGEYIDALLKDGETPDQIHTRVSKIQKASKKARIQGAEDLSEALHMLGKKREAQLENNGAFFIRHGSADGTKQQSNALRSPDVTAKP